MTDENQELAESDHLIGGQRKSTFVGILYKTFLRYMPSDFAILTDLVNTRALLT